MRVVNLLPKSRQKELYFDSILRVLWSLLIFSLLTFAVVFVAQFGTKFYLEIEAGVIKNQIKDLQVQVNKQENSDVKAKVKAANDLVADYQGLAAAAPKWSKLVKAFVPLPPQGVKITSFTPDPTSRLITITGTSPTRELVIALYNNILQDTDHFYGIDYPLENIVNETDVNFHFHFYYKPELVQ